MIAIQSLVMKRMLHGLGMALMLASPFWLTLEDPPDYYKFGTSLALGLLLNMAGILYPKSDGGR
ncbi:MAG TPA: hypothetical protein VMS96_09655 [Terriglobales bacterium]|nr:hypothetical protein [Terriglobales bacterium]